MKTNKITIFIALLTSVILLTGTSIQAQKRSKRKVKSINDIPHITEEQKSKIKTIRIERKEKSKALVEQIKGKNKELSVLMKADRADLNAINRKIDEIGQLNTQLKKHEASKTQEIRTLLDTEQRKYYDENIMAKGHRFKKR